MDADSPTLKRPFAGFGGQETFQHCYQWEPHDCEAAFVRSFGLTKNRSIPSPTKRRSISYSPTPSMPIQTSAAVSTAFPSFASVFGNRNSCLRDGKTEDGLDEGLKNSSHEPPAFPNAQPSTAQYSLPPTYHHRETAVSVCSDSAGSSPTTTISTFDSPPITDPSPSSSPESPTSIIPLSSFKAMMTTPMEHRADEYSDDSSTLSPNPSDQQTTELAGSNPRNVKNLSLNMNVASAPRPVTSPGFERSPNFSTPTSPLRGPLKTGRRKPTNLTIRTPGPEKTSFAGISNDVPPTPGQRPLLQHFQSSPVFPSLLSIAPLRVGGTQLPAQSIGLQQSRPTLQSSIAFQSVTDSEVEDLTVREDDLQPPKSQEKQERGYPNGPIKVYDSGVYLYLEPTREEAASFDTVINVAKEIKNPFAESQSGTNDSVMSIWRKETDVPRTPEPQTAVSEVSFKSAFEWPLPGETTSPTTPKAELPKVETSAPEYIQVPWDHNSEIIEDLFPLCQIIDARVAAGKTVLIHCQLGVSRSASLIIAYGLYQGFKMDFHSMYNAVKERSQWVGPNMSLIYQLMDFRSRLEKGQFAAAPRAAPPEWFQPPRVTNHSIAPAAPVAGVAPLIISQPLIKDFTTSTNETPKAIKPAVILMKALPPVPLFPKHPSRQQITPGSSNEAEPPSGTDSSPAPLPAPSVSDSSSTNPSIRAVPRPFPLRERMAPSMQSPDSPSHGLRNTTLRLSENGTQMDLAMHDVPKTPSLFSPRQTEFMATSFGRTLAGDLAVETAARTSEPVQRSNTNISISKVDPRSPHQRNETGEIMRHIDDVL